MSNEFLVLDYILNHFIPFLVIPFTLLLTLIGFMTRFVRGGLDF